MTTVCASEQHNKLHPSHQFVIKPFKDVDIPPRKLLLSAKLFQDSSSPDLNMLSPFHSNLRKFLPFNDDDDDGDDGEDDDQDFDPYSSDHFRMYEFKVRRCTRSRSHDWTDCPFAHPGEKARRRDPRKFHYSGTVCPEFRRGGCSRGDSCEFAHGVFECWLHPSRYRTEACKDGKNCKRKVCFFAHSPGQLRILPKISCGSVSNKHSNCCCLACHSMISSPTSTLLGMSHMSPPLSPSLSPPLSPVKHRPASGVSAIRYNDRLSKFRSGIMSYRDVLTELMSSLEAVNFNESAADHSRKINKNNIPNWIDISSFNEEDVHQQQKQQFVLSPSNVGFNGDCSRNKALFHNNDNNLVDNKSNDNGGNGGGDGGSGGGDPDLGWVNELLM